jgi:hypothetical protein
MDTGFAVQVLVVLLLVIGGIYAAGLIKSKGLKTNKLDILLLINSFIASNVLEGDQAKEVSRAIGSAVRFVEVNMKDCTNEEKEDAAVSMVLDVLESLNLGKEVDVDTLKNIISIAVSFLPATKLEEVVVTQ